MRFSTYWEVFIILWNHPTPPQYEKTLETTVHHMFALLLIWILSWMNEVLMSSWNLDEETSICTLVLFFLPEPLGLSTPTGPLSNNETQAGFSNHKKKSFNSANMVVWGSYVGIQLIFSCQKIEGRGVFDEKLPPAEPCLPNVSKKSA